MGAMFEAICSWSNLLEAARKAARGKRGKRTAAAFELRLADQLLAVQGELLERSYRPGRHRHFQVHEPKRRLISAAPFVDRVVHHALCAHLVPLFEASFHPRSFANRVGYGTHRALDTLQGLAQRHRHALRCDVVQHFPSIDHAILRDKLARRVRDEGVLWLMDRLLEQGADEAAAAAPQTYFDGDDLWAVCRPRGLPIGNLSSQFWSNVYLNDLDWYVTRGLGCGAYVRYVDDFVLLGDSPARLWEMRQQVIDRLARCERLRLHLGPAQVVPVAQGLPWLGFVVYPTHRRLKRRQGVNFTRHLRGLLAGFREGRVSFAELDASVQGWINHVRFADTWGLRESIFAQHPVRGGGA